MTRRLVHVVRVGEDYVCADSETGEIVVGVPGEGDLVMVECATSQTAKKLAEEFGGRKETKTWTT